MNREKQLEQVLRGMVRRFAYQDTDARGTVIHTGGLPVLKRAFRLLGMKDPTYTHKSRKSLSIKYEIR